MVERSLSMREARGSIPRLSTFFAPESIFERHGDRYPGFPSLLHPSLFFMLKIFCDCRLSSSQHSADPAVSTGHSADPASALTLAEYWHSIRVMRGRNAVSFYLPFNA